MRATNEKVKKIISTNMEDVSQYIETASILVNEYLEGKGVSAPLLEIIEIYLTAHFIAISEPQIKSISFGDAEESYTIPKRGINLQSSVYGQTAMSLDTTGRLANMGKTVASLYYL